MPGPHRVIVGEPPAEPSPAAPRRYGRLVRNHDPFAHHRRYDVPQLPGGRLEDGQERRPQVNILACVDRYPPIQNAGAEWMLHHLLRDSVRRGHRAIVVTATPDAYTLEGVRVVPHRDLHELAPQADVMVGHLMWTREAVETAALYQRPLVYLVHNDAQLHHWKLTPDNLTIAVANSRWIGASSVAKWEQARGAVGLVRPPVLIDDYALARDPWTAPFVTLSNPTKEKGAEVFYTLARRPPARRYLTVEGAYGEQTRPNHTTPNVTWQPQTGDMLNDVYAHTRVLLVPSWYESWGRVATEAMCSGIPVIANPTDGLVEALGTAGIFVDRTDIDGWQAVLSMLDDEDYYRRVSLASYQRASELTLQAQGDLNEWNRILETCGALNPSTMTAPPIAEPAQVASPV